MPTNSAKITIGRADVALSAYVAAGAAGTFTDIGHSKGPVTIEPVVEEYKVMSEQAMGTIRSVPIKAGYRIKFTIMEADLSRMRQILSQPSANLVTSGTTPNIVETLSVGDPQEIYFQIKVTTKGAKRALADPEPTRTYTLWRCRPEAIDPIGHSKESEAVFGVTFDVLQDDSVATADKYWKAVDTPLV